MTKLGYTVTRFNNKNRYDDVNIDIIILDDYKSEIICTFEMTIANDGHSYFYQFKNTYDSHNHIKELIYVLRKFDIFRENNMVDVESMIGFTESLKGGKRMIYDGRVSNYINIDEIQDLDLHPYGASNPKTGYCDVSCLALSHEDAEDKLNIILREYNIDKWKGWVSNNCPIVKHAYTLPNIQTIEEILCSK